MSTHVFTNTSRLFKRCLCYKTEMFFSHLIPSNHCCSLVCILKQHSSSMRWIVVALLNISSCKRLPNCSFAWQRFHIFFLFFPPFCHMQEYALENVTASRRVISYICSLHVYRDGNIYICRDCTRLMIEQKVNKGFVLDAIQFFVLDKIVAIQFPRTALL